MTANYKANNFKSEIKKLGLNAIFLDIKPISSAFAKSQLIWHFFADISKLRRAMVGLQPDLIHVCGELGSSDRFWLVSVLSQRLFGI